MNRFFRTICVATLCGLVMTSSCNGAKEEVARLVEQISKVRQLLENDVSEVKQKLEKEVSEVKRGFEEMRQDIESLNEAVAKLVFALLENKPEAESVHNVERRAVISDNPLTNLLYGDISGLVGAPGRDGEDGRDGPTGPPGPPGAPGKYHFSLKASGAVYSRWGRTTCGRNSALLYTGYAGGSNYDQTGGGTNIQCMPLDPKYNRYYTGASTWYGSWIAGVEYQTDIYGIFPNNAYDQNVPCARCYTNNRSALMMIPAKRDCAEGWTKEYEGYLMTEYYNRNHQTTFECVDQNPEYVRGESVNTNGGMLYFVRTQCNRGGHCPPYEGNKELTCVVCSK